MSNLQGQFVTSSEVIRLAFGQEQYPLAAVQTVSPTGGVVMSGTLIYVDYF